MCFNIDMLGTWIIKKDGSIQSSVLEDFIQSSLGELQRVLPPCVNH